MRPGARQRSTIMIVNKAKLFAVPMRLDERDFETIFVEYYAKVYAILFRLTGDRYEADDLAAETFWRLWERPPAQNENLGGWLYRVASNLGYNLLRAKRRRKNYEEKVGLDALDAHHSLDPAAAAETEIERKRVRKILSELSLREAQVLVLRHSGLSYKEIAAAIHVAPASVGTLLARAEERFEKFYHRGEKDAPEN
jgi:RNA polymerase sigma-70 factor, ECF subfamily